MRFLFSRPSCWTENVIKKKKKNKTHPRLQLNGLQEIARRQRRVAETIKTVL